MCHISGDRHISYYAACGTRLLWQRHALSGSEAIQLTDETRIYGCVHNFDGALLGLEKNTHK